ncbi:MAG: hypothetical protein U9Q69_06275 [Nanoarchaeota archaeon]|nr:hypothetical protein [Nanoarchaeota archaeon]
MKKKLFKKAEGGAEMSIFVLLLAFFILIYVLLLPPAERELLLNETISSSENAAGISTSKVLISDAPGEVYSYTTNIHKVSIQPIQIYSKMESNIYSLIKSMTVSHNLLKDNYKQIYFNLDNLESLSDLKLVCLISEHKGPISIYLNSKLIFEGELSTLDLPLDLPIMHLQKNNKLEFYSSSPGFKIFSSNHYILKDVSLIKEYKVEKTKARRAFLINKEIGERIRKASLEYFITCNSANENPRLKISLNNDNLFNDDIFCNYLEKRTLPLPIESINKDGNNILIMEIDKGDINIDEIQVKSELSKSIYPTYIFDIGSDLWKKINDGTKIFLKLNMEEDTRKRAKIIIQENTFYLNSYSETYEKDITNLLDNGANVIQIIPQNNFKIVNLKVYEE